MDEQISWTGGISDRQIFADSAVFFVKWLAIAVPVGLLLWWLSDLLSIPERLRSGTVALAGVGAVLILGFIKSHRKT